MVVKWSANLLSLSLLACVHRFEYSRFVSLQSVTVLRPRRREMCVRAPSWRAVYDILWPCFWMKALAWGCFPTDDLPRYVLGGFGCLHGILALNALFYPDICFWIHQKWIFLCLGNFTVQTWMLVKILGITVSHRDLISLFPFRLGPVHLEQAAYKQFILCCNCS